MRIQTQQGTITINDTSVTVPVTGYGKGVARWSTALGKGREIPFSEIHSVSVGGNNKQYMTGRRAAGVILTGGVALLAPTRVRGQLVIGTTSGDVLTYQLGRREARNPESIAMAFNMAGVTVV
jgi:hypothetical protein